MRARGSALVLGAACAAALFFAAPASATLGFLSGPAGFDSVATGAGGVGPETQAGSHPYSLLTTINFRRDGEDVREIQLELPGGLIENPGAVLKCTQAQFHTPRISPFEASRSGESCPPLSQIGVVEVRSSIDGDVPRTFGLFNLTPPEGAPSQIGASPYGMPVTFTPRIRELGGEFGLTLESDPISQALDLDGLTLTVWGNPWSIAHNGLRGACLNEEEPRFPFAKCSLERGGPHLPFAYLTMPASCAGPLGFQISANSWQRPATMVAAGALSRNDAGVPSGLTGCAGLRFEPLTQAQLTNPRASSPSGLNFSLTPKEEALTDPRLNVPAQTRVAVVALPEGVTLNPSLAAGLSACTPAGYAAETVTSPPGAGCPAQSKIGSFTVASPLFEAPVDGDVYLAQPDDPATPTAGAENPFDSLLAVYLVAKTSASGVLVKVPGELAADPASGRLTATFDQLPQLPYSNLKIHFREGQRAPLVTPPLCGSFSAKVDLTPWNDLSGSVRSEPELLVTKGLGAGDACPGAVTPPFAPGAVGGTLNANAGSYSPLYLHLTRTDAEQEFTSYSATLPPGLTGKIAGIPFCPDGAIEAARKESGRAEEEHPSCPAASEIGHTISGYGVGAVPAYAPGRLYLAGPYRGSAFSVVAIDSAKVGPFDLGTIIVRSGIKVDPQTAQVQIDSSGSDPIPHILDGIPIHLRDIRVYVDRPQTTLNPTSCEPFALSSRLTGSGARFSDPSDDSVATVSSHFQVEFCGELGFTPRFTLHLSGGTRRGQFPALHVDLRPLAGDANIGRAAVTLPPSIFLAQEHLKAVCSLAQFKAEACPPGSVYGQASAITPLLGRPLRGKVYMRSSANKLPDLAIALRGDGIAINLLGRIDSHHGGLRATFDHLPDAPVTDFTLSLRGGRHGLLVDAADLCAAPRRATARFIGQNNLGQATRPLVHAECHRRKR